ncbi:glycerophosphodiester phosphodiesterase family protein [Rothia sp. LK2588]|uniref:glycerophosphodiester phosphodiesterase family protein n=1 Tax=Rothia sp. LK2588 TaxID=3114369 RepID=UPI0034CFEE58
MTRRIFAHRGLSAIAPENTLAAIGAGADHGVRWFETDVDVIGDGTAVVLHDPTLDRTTNRTGPATALTAADLPDVDAGGWFSPEFAGQPLPTLGQLVDLMNEKKLDGNIELKPHAPSKEGVLKLVEAAIAELERLDAERRVVISSFHHLALAEFKRRAPQYEVAPLMWAQGLEVSWQSQLEMLDSTTIHPHHLALTPELVAQMKDAGITINTWTVNDRARTNQLFNWGVDGVITDLAHEFVHLER